MCPFTDNRRNNLLKAARRVRFATTKSGIIETKKYDSTYTLTSIVERSLWWTKSQREENRMEAYVDVSIAKEDLCDEGKSSQDFPKIIAKVHRALWKGRKIPEALKSDFLIETAVHHSLRGLEKFLVDAIKADRRQRRHMVVLGVLCAQEDCENLGMCYAEKALRIRGVSERITKESTAIAKTYGEADEFASKLGMNVPAIESLSTQGSPITDFLSVFETPLFNVEKWSPAGSVLATLQPLAYELTTPAA